ncbi:CGNR zinc finger domain-containing protein [Longispora albida]|uniref:CGNR zinc finger domain-containing protein n=1 Tax=Longispora albida TaxID=203523 RepID=UPI00036B5B07|nr:CGNR zinc finger domain-containing protein [Longispora albida]
MTETPAEAEPEARRPAPGGLRLVQDFCNSTDFEGGWDVLDTPEGLAGWLADHGHPAAAPLGQSDVERAITFREALRDACAVGAEDAGETRARGRAYLNEASRDLPLHVNLSEEGAALEPVADGLPGALAAMLGALAAGHADGTAARLKACEAHSCRWVFYDQSRNGSSRWCTMRLCGARSKNRAYRMRLRESSG